MEPEPAWHWTSDGETDLPPPTTIDAAIDPVRDGCAPQGNCTADCTLPCDAEHRGAPTFLVCDLCGNFDMISDIPVPPPALFPLP